MKTTRLFSFALAASLALACAAIAVFGMPDFTQAAPALLLMATAPLALNAGEGAPDPAAGGDPAAPPAGDADKPKPAAKVKMVKARVLYDGPHGKVNAVVTVPADLAKQDEHLDPDPAAVAYAESLKA